jgi:CRISPR-associated protein Csd1
MGIERNPFVLVLDETGSLVQIEDTREGQQNRGKKFLVPQAEKKTSGIKANLLWDTPAYVFGIQDLEGLFEKERNESDSACLSKGQHFLIAYEMIFPTQQNEKPSYHFLKMQQKNIFLNIRTGPKY